MYKPGQPIPVVAPYLTAQQLQAFMQSMADTVTTAADPRQRAAAPRQEPPQLALVVQRLQSRLAPAQLAVLGNMDSPGHAPAALCSAIVR